MCGVLVSLRQAPFPLAAPPPTLPLAQSCICSAQTRCISTESWTLTKSLPKHTTKTFQGCASSFISCAKQRALTPVSPFYAHVHVSCRTNLPRQLPSNLCRRSCRISLGMVDGEADDS